MVEYLEEQFQGMYEYLSNGERVEEFLLLSHQAMIILEVEEEFAKIIQNSMDIEEIDEPLIMRIGVRHWNEIQLHYKIIENT